MADSLAFSIVFVGLVKLRWPLILVGIEASFFLGAAFLLALALGRGRFAAFLTVLFLVVVLAFLGQLLSLLIKKKG